MPPRKPLSRPEPKLTLVGIPVAIHRYRVLFADGETLDFLAYSDHSGIRGEMLDIHYGKRPEKDKHNDPKYKIEGIADLGIEYVHTPGA